MYPANRNTLKILAFLIMVCLPQGSKSQDIEGDMVYSVDLMTNPAFSGARGYGNMKLIYRDYFPGNNLDLNTIYLAYDTYLESIQGGMGFYISEDKSGDILSDLRSGASYSYHLRAGNELYINAGFMASLIYRRLNRSNIVFPDQIDPILGPVLGTEELLDFKSRVLFDVGVGFLMSYRNYNAGISFNHLAKPDLVGHNKEDDRLKRRITIHGDAEFKTGLKDLSVSPLFFTNLQGQFLYGAAGACLNFKPLTISMMVHADLYEGVNALQPGFSFETGRIRIAYNYFFKAFGNESGIPITHSNLVSLSISLNNVDNSGVMKAIKYPKL